MFIIFGMKWHGWSDNPRWNRFGNVLTSLVFIWIAIEFVWIVCDLAKHA